MSRDTASATDRRTYLRVAGATGLAAFAGCVSTTDDEEDAGGADDGGEESDAGGESGDEGDAASDDADESASAGPYQIGMVDSLTGSLSAFGERNQRGVELALGRVNEQGIDGRDLELIVEDSESENQGGIAAAQKLVNQDEVPFLIGAVGSGVSLAIYESVIQGTDVVQLSQNSTGLNLTDFPGLLRMSPSGRTQSLALANLIAEDGYDEVAITYVNNDYGQSLTDAFVDAWDGDVVYNTPHD